MGFFSIKEIIKEKVCLTLRLICFSLAAKMRAVIIIFRIFQVKVQNYIVSRHLYIIVN